MPEHPNNFVQLVAYYNTLLTRFTLRLTGGNITLAEALVKDAMEEAWEEDKFYEGKELRLLLKNKILGKVKGD